MKRRAPYSPFVRPNSPPRLTCSAVFARHASPTTKTSSQWCAHPSLSPQASRAFHLKPRCLIKTILEPSRFHLVFKAIKQRCLLYGFANQNARFILVSIRLTSSMLCCSPNPDKPARQASRWARPGAPAARALRPCGACVPARPRHYVVDLRFLLKRGSR